MMEKLQYYVTRAPRWWRIFSYAKELTRAEMLDMIHSEVKELPSTPRDVHGEVRTDKVALVYIAAVESGAAVQINSDRIYFSTALDPSQT
jgi:hypothetical protein